MHISLWHRTVSVTCKFIAFCVARMSFIKTSHMYGVDYVRKTASHTALRNKIDIFEYMHT